MQRAGMKQTLDTINRMQTDGVIGEYAIGGAVGATLYLEPAATLDVDVFVVLPKSEQHGGGVQHEHIVIGGWPVQFLPPSNELEHLVAIALRTGRAKDRARIIQFVEQKAV